MSKELKKFMLTRNGLYSSLVSLCKKHERLAAGVLGLTQVVKSRTYLTEKAVDYLLCEVGEQGLIDHFVMKSSKDPKMYVERGRAAHELLKGYRGMTLTKIVPRRFES